MEELNKAIETKKQLLRFYHNGTEKLIVEGNIVHLCRHKKIFEDKINEIHEIKVRVQELKIESGEEFEETQEWTTNLEGEVKEFEEAMNKIDKEIKQLKDKELEATRFEEEKFEAAKREKKFEEELKFEKLKLEQKLKYEKKIEQEGQAKQNKTETTKLPKLVISKFNGTHTDWLRFWGQFEAEIEASNVATITKFSYLKELLNPKVKTIIDALPLTTEGYERAKNILKSRYGKTSEIVNAYVSNIMSLPKITGTNSAKISEFYETLLSSAQALESMSKLKDINGYVRMTLDKLEGIRGDLVRTDDDWQEWTFPQLIEALRKWTQRNPPKVDEKPVEKPQQNKPYKTRNFQVKQQETKAKTCVYCESKEHKSVNCDKVTTAADRRKHLSANQLCFNCTGQHHKASECRCTTTCQLCHKKHHTSICTQKVEQMLVATAGKGKVIYPVVVVCVQGIKCRALLDTGAGSSYASAALLDRIKARPLRKEYRRIEMMMQTTNREIEIYEVAVTNVSGEFQLKTEVTKVNRGTLLTVDNPHYEALIQQYAHLRGVSMDDKDHKEELPVHLILGTSEYAQIKTRTAPKIGALGEPIAEQTHLGWTIMSPGKEANLTNMFLTQISTPEYDNLCRLDVLGIEDRPSGDQESVYEEFKEQLRRSSEGWYETGLLWKGNHPPLPSNRAGSLKRLDSLIRKLDKQPGLVEKYDAIIRDQLEQGIVEPAPEAPEGKEFYIPHKPVIRETAETTKTRVVYDGSARASEKSPSLNDCLEIGPPLQNRIWSVLVRNRFYPVAITGDMKQAFLQVRIREEDRDSLRFHWLKDVTTREKTVLRFTRALFGLSTSPFLLGGVIEQHLAIMEAKYPEEVREIKRILYVDDLIGGGKTASEANHLKQTARAIFGEGGFELHKWHSNIPALEEEMKPTEEVTTTEQTMSTNEIEQSFAKEQLGVKRGESKLLGQTWNKVKDTLEIGFAEPVKQITKREILGKIARIYDPLGLASPITLTGKTLYREACDRHLSWDRELPVDLTTKWKNWELSLPVKLEVPRSLPTYQEEIEAIDLHAFGDASGLGVATAVYATVQQPSGTTQGLVAARSRLAKKGLTMPRLELVAGHMSANLVHNVKQSLEDLPVRNVYSWLDSTVALHWIKGNGDYKQFVHNRVRKIQEKPYIQWRYVQTSQNPADLPSRGGQVTQESNIWLEGPHWLSEPEDWPVDITTYPTKESQTEAKLTREVLAVTVKEEDPMNKVLEKMSYWKAIRVTSWIRRFIINCREKREDKLMGPLTTEEVNKQVTFWVKRAQHTWEATSKFQEDKERLGLREDGCGVYRCYGRIQGDYPIYLPDQDLLTKKMLMHIHLVTLHGGVGMTMTKIRELYWVPRLRRLARKVVKECHGCKRFQAQAMPSPPSGNLPKDRTEGTVPFNVIGVDYAGPIKYLAKNKKEKKAYIILYSCSLTRALYLELLPDQTEEEFLRSLKRMIARKGKPQTIYSDNGKTFVAAAKWLRRMEGSERVRGYLCEEGIKWKFNLSRAPWWGGQFERLVGLVKQALYKSIGGGLLRWHELEEVILDIETALNNRPLTYVEDDIQMPILTPNMMVFGKNNLIPEPDYETIEDCDLRKRAKYISRCKDVLWSRWTKEYLKALRERHNLKHKSREMTLKPGDVVVIKGDERNRGKWRIGIVDELFEGRDGVIRAVRLRAGKSFLERPVQHLYPLELSCGRATENSTTTELNVNAPDFKPRQTRRAAAEARDRITAIVKEDLEDD